MKRLFVISCVLLIVACNGKFEGFTSLGNDVYYKLLTFEDDSKQYDEEDWVIANIVVRDENKVIFRHFKYIPFLPKKKMFDNIITHFKSGDSLRIIIPQEVFNDNGFGYYVKDCQSGYLKVDIKIHDFISASNYIMLKAEKDDEIIEQQILKEYLSSIKNITTINGISYVKLKKTKGESVKHGKTINIKYTGEFTNGIVFDTTFANKPFEYSYGTPNQVIEGLEEVLKVLKNGEKAKIIIPSQFAFGEQGSSTGIVPPYSTVIYNIEIINIK